MDEEKNYTHTIIAVVSILLFSIFICLVNYYTDTEERIVEYEVPTQYESKPVGYFKVIRVFGNGALASSAVNEEQMLQGEFFNGVVMLRGYDFKEGEVVTLKNPKVVGQYSYCDDGLPRRTVPIVE